MKKIALLLSMLMLVTLVLGGAALATEDKTYKVAGIYKFADAAWFLTEGEAANAKLQELSGDKVDWMYLDAKQDGNTLLQMIDTVIAEGVDGVICCPSDQTLSNVVVEKLSEAGIPVVAADDELIDAEGNLLAPWRGISGYDIGAESARWAVTYMEENNLIDDPECAIMVMTTETVASCIPRSEGQLDVFAELIPDFENVFTVDYTMDMDIAFNAANGVIVANPQFTKWIVVTTADEGTVGATRALEQAGLDANSCTIGLGGTHAAGEFEKGSCFKAVAYFSASGVGELTAEAIWALIQGEEIEDRDAVGAIMVTPENYKELMTEYL